MDPNNSQRPISQVTQPSVQPQPLPSAPPEKKGSKGMLLALVLVVLLLVLGVFGFMAVNTNRSAQQVALQQPIISPTPVAQPTAVQTAEEQEVESVALGDTSSADLVAVENEIKGL